MEAPPLAPQAAGSDFSPLDFLLSVMNDPDAAPHLRIKVAHAAAPYIHARAGQTKPDEAVIEDPYGFTFDLDVARALREDIVALQKHASHSEDEKRAIKARIFERQITLPDPPATYKQEDFEWEQGRLEKLEIIQRKKRPGSKQAQQVEAEAVILTGRVKTFEASLERSKLRRLHELTDKMNAVGLTYKEDPELRRLYDRFPHLDRPQFGERPRDPYWEACRSYSRDPDKMPAYPPSDEDDFYWKAQRDYAAGVERDAREKAKRSKRY